MVQALASPGSAYRALLAAFAAGALSVAIFQSGLSGLFYLTGLTPNRPWQMGPIPPFGVPQLISNMFWGGLWGLVMLPVLTRARNGPGYWLTALLFGGIVVSAVLLFIVLPLKGRPFAAGWDMKVWARIFALHAAFGLGTAAFLRMFTRSR